MGMTMSNNRNSPPPMRPDIAPKRRMDFPGLAPKPSESSEPFASEGKKLLVGRDIFLTGEITACNRLLIEGRVEASLAESQSIEIALGAEKSRGQCPVWRFGGICSYRDSRQP